MKGTMLRARLEDDEGSSMILTIGMAMFALLLVLVLTVSTSLLIERRQLFTIADGAAVVAAETFTVEVLDDGTGRPVPILDEDAMQPVVEAWVAAADSSGEVVVLDVRTVDAETAQVTLATRWRPFAVTWLLPDGIRLDVTVTARSVFGQ